jgi:hypothetical protein
MVLYFGEHLQVPINSLTCKKVIRIMTGHGVRTSCRHLFKELEILPLKSKYIFSILLFVARIKKKLFISNYDSNNTRTRQCENLHYPSPVLTLYQKGVYFLGIKIFNELSSHLKELVDYPKIFKRALKDTYFFILFTNWRSFTVLTLNLFLMYFYQLNLHLSVCLHV